MAGSVMSTGTGYMLYRRAFCLFWKALHHFQLQTPETAACLEQIQPKGRERAFQDPLWLSVHLSGIIVLKCQHVKSRNLAFKGIGYRVKVSGVVALCHMLMHFHAINQVT